MFTRIFGIYGNLFLFLEEMDHKLVSGVEALMQRVKFVNLKPPQLWSIVGVARFGDVVGVVCFTFYALFVTPYQSLHVT